MLGFVISFWYQFGAQIGVFLGVILSFLNAIKKTVYSGPLFWKLKTQFVVVSCVTVFTFNVNLIFFGTPNQPQNDPRIRLQIPENKHLK